MFLTITSHLRDRGKEVSVSFNRVLKGVFITVFSIVISVNASAETIKLMSWNIANLAEPGKSLRGVERTPDDYNVLRRIIVEQKPDVLALQEIGSIAAAKAILPDGYQFKFEKRCYENSTSCMSIPESSDEEDIYTVIAIKNELLEKSNATFFNVSSQIDGVEQGMDIYHQSECIAKKPRKVRGAVGVQLRLDGGSLFIPSVHIKATCKNVDRESDDATKDDCSTGKKQMQILGGWAKSVTAEGSGYIVAGDFNREFLKSNNKTYKKAFESASNHKFDVFPKKPKERLCWAPEKLPYDKNALVKQVTSINDVNNKLYGFQKQGLEPVLFEPRFSHEIDFFLLNASLVDKYMVSSQQVPMEGDYRLGDISEFTITNCDGNITELKDNKSFFFAESFPSDHCPIVMELNLN